MASRAGELRHSARVAPGSAGRSGLGPVNRPVQRRRSSFTVLLESQVDAREPVARVGDVIEHKPSRQRVAAAALPRPVQAALGWIVERIADQIGVVANFQGVDTVHYLEIPG